MSAGVKLWVRTGEPNKGSSSVHLNRSKVPALSDSPIDQINFLQRTVGNRGVERLLRPRIVQAKLKVNKSGDVYEREADRISDQVLATPMPASVSGASGIQRAVSQPVAETAAAPASVDRALVSGGKPLEPTLQREMEQRFGWDFSQVRVHLGPAAEQSAREVNARAYTVGQSLVFGANEFNPETRQGRRLLAHELTHVVQQTGAYANVVRRSNGFEDEPTLVERGNPNQPPWRGHVERGGERIPANQTKGEIPRGPTPGGGAVGGGGGAAGAGVVEGASVLGGGAGAVVAGAVPVIAMVGVFLALGSGYAAAREAVRNENTVSGVSQGFVMGLLDWTWRQAVDRFGRRSVIRINAMDEATDVIRVNAYNRGLRAGYDFAATLSADEKKAYLSRIRKFGGIRVPKNWNRNRDAQISYVIELAAAALRSFLKRE
jgi:hypothetical protein